MEIVCQIDMKLLIFLRNCFCLQFCFFDVSDFSSFKKGSSYNHSDLAMAVHQIVAETFRHAFTTVNLLSTDNNTLFTINDFKDDLMSKRLKSIEIIWKQETALNLEGITGLRRRFVIVLAQNLLHFYKIFDYIVAEKFQLNGLYLIVLFDEATVDIEKIFKRFWSIQIYNVDVMKKDELGSVLINTFSPFTLKNCDDTSMVLLNEFKDGAFVKTSSSFFPNKMKNLHNCSIRVSAVDTSKSSITSKGDKVIDINLINALSQSLNFNINYTYTGTKGFFFDNGSAQGSLKVLLNRDADLSISYWWINFSRLKYFDVTSSYVSDKIIFLIPPGRDFTAFEKLSLPFSSTVWVLIFICFAVALVVIAIFKFQPKNVRSFVFGSGVNNPVLNMAVAFIGGSQKILPQRNFARFLLMLFLMYSLVIRTLYQASFYKFLKSNQSQIKVHSIEEMIEKDFKFYALFHAVEMLRGSEATKNR